MKNKKNILLFVKNAIWILFIISFVAVCVVQYYSSDIKRIKNIDVVFYKSENNFLKSSDIVHFVEQKYSNIMHSRISEINISALEKHLISNQYIQNSDINFTKNGILKIFVEYKNPYMRIINKNNNFYVDKDWNKIPNSKKISKRLVCINGNITWLFQKNNDTISSLYLNNFKKMVDYINNNKFWNSAIDQLYINNDKTVDIILAFDCPTIKFGLINLSFPKRLNKIYNFLKITSLNIDLTKYRGLDCRYKNQIIAIK